MDEQETLEASKIEWASDEYCSLVWGSFYNEYENLPFISKYREQYTNWINEMGAIISHSLVSKEKLTYFDDGLFPGHIYLMYWLMEQKEIYYPVYFEFEYGINPQFARDQLFEYGFLDESNMPTAKGMIALQKHLDVIEERHPQPKYSYFELLYFSVSQLPKFDIDSIEEGISTIPDTDKDLIEKIVKLLTDISIRAFKMVGIEEYFDLNELTYSLKHTHYDCTHLTPSGRKKKIPLTIRLDTYKEDDEKKIKDLSTDELVDLLNKDEEETGTGLVGNICFDQEGLVHEFVFYFWNSGGLSIKGKKDDEIISIVEISESDKGKWCPIYKKEHISLLSQIILK